MKVTICGDDKHLIEPVVTASGFEIVESNPDFVVSFGGDGTVMRSESEFPGIPKIVLRNSGICKKCSALSNEEVLKRVFEGRYTIEELPKLVASAKGVRLVATNDINVHNQNPRTGIRYTLLVNGKPPLFNDKPYEREVIGDGLVVATPFGSTGYYRSITDSYFEVGMGLAFNNSIEQSDHMVLKDTSVLELTITRGPAEVFADNHKESIPLDAGDSVSIKKSDKTAKIVCPDLIP